MCELTGILYLDAEPGIERESHFILPANNQITVVKGVSEDDDILDKCGRIEVEKEPSNGNWEKADYVVENISVGEYHKRLKMFLLSGSGWFQVGSDLSRRFRSESDKCRPGVGSTACYRQPTAAVDI